MNKIENLHKEAVQLLKELIAIPSISREEKLAAERIIFFFQEKNIPYQTEKNNVFAYNKFYDKQKPTLVLNSHIDTVKPNKAYTLDPFTPIEEDGKIFGLGSNDAGGCLVSLLITFFYFYEKENIKYNIVFLASTEEEITGDNGAIIAIPKLGKIDCAIVGEPTKMQLAVAERGLLVVDCVAEGKAGHVAKNDGINALYNAMDDIAWIKNYNFKKVSELLGETKMNVTAVQTSNQQHNVVPPDCSFIVDVRINELYQSEEVLDIMQKNLKSKCTARSFKLKSTMIDVDHPLVKAGTALGLNHYGSPTCSDKALMPCPTIKMGPGDSLRSHIANEFIYSNEIKEGIEIYIRLLENFLEA